MINNPESIVDEITLILISYLIGCICVGYYLVKFILKEDVRSSGSGNAGARNVGRKLGKFGFIFTLLGDAVKAYIMVALVVYLKYPAEFQIMIIIAVIIGHMWPIQLKFNGGKGYATMIGGMLAYDVNLFALVVILSAVLVIIFRQIKLAGLVAIVLIPVAAIIEKQSSNGILGLSIMVLLVAYAHKDNFQHEYKKWKPFSGKEK